MNQVILTLEDVTIRCGSFSLFIDFLAVERGECLYVIGANGSGKSTLLRGILNLVPLTGGQVVRAARTAWVPQSEEADKNFPATVREIVLTGRQGTGLPFYTRADRRAADEALDIFGLSGLAGRRIGALSGGQRQRVFLARALCGRPELLLLDEPCTGLDEEGRRIVRDQLTLMRRERGMSVIMVTHDIHDLDLESSACRVAELDAGRLKFIGAMDAWRGRLKKKEWKE